MIGLLQYFKPGTWRKIGHKYPIEVSSKCELAFSGEQAHLDILGIRKIIRPKSSLTLLSQGSKSSFQCVFLQPDLLPLSESSVLLLAHCVSFACKFESLLNDRRIKTLQYLASHTEPVSSKDIYQCGSVSFSNAWAQPTQILFRLEFFISIWKLMILSIPDQVFLSLLHCLQS